MSTEGEKLVRRRGSLRRFWARHFQWLIVITVALFGAGCATKHLSLEQYAAVLTIQNKTTEPLAVYIVDGRNNARLGAASPGKTAEFGIPSTLFGENDFVYFRANAEKAPCATLVQFKAVRNTRANFFVRTSSISMDVAGGVKPPCVIVAK